MCHVIFKTIINLCRNIYSVFTYLFVFCGIKPYVTCYSKRLYTHLFSLYLDGSLHYTKFRTSAGGVGRNICEALEKLGAKPMLLSVVGNDNQGTHLRSRLSPFSTKAVKIIPGSSTAQCTVVLDSNGDCKLLLGEMDIHKQITADLITTQRELLIQSPLIVTDGNLPVETLSCVLEIAKQYGKPIFYEPTDVPVAANPFLTKHLDGLKYISPNMNELRFIVKALGFSIPKEPHSIIWEACELGRIVSDYVDTIFITLGVMGLIVIRKASATDPLFLNNGDKNGDVQIRHYPTTEILKLVNVSGAGDCLASGLIYAMLAGKAENVCVSVGLAAAKMALQSPSAVPKIMFDKSHESWQQEAFCIQL